MTGQSCLFVSVSLKALFRQITGFFFFINYIIGEESRIEMKPNKNALACPFFKLKTEAINEELPKRPWELNVNVTLTMLRSSFK